MRGFPPSDTFFADLGLLLAQDAAERERARRAATADRGLEPYTLDALDAQILAGLVLP